MTRLILLNGPPASGKSTIARRFVESKPLALNLDIDIVRSMLGAWLTAPHEAGLAARSLALAMAETHLGAGHDVIVPQYLGRTEFIDQLAATADKAQATFIETALWLDRQTAIAVFADRRRSPSSQAHYDAAALVDRSFHADPVGQIYDRFAQVMEARPATRRIGVVRGDVEATFKRLTEALDIYKP